MDNIKSNLKGEICPEKQPSVSASEAGLEECCFTCFRKTDDCLRIIEGDAVNEANRAAIFAQHFWFTRDEYYNRTICRSCWSSIDDFHRFYCQVEEHHPQPEPTRIKVERLEETFEIELDPSINDMSGLSEEDDLDLKQKPEDRKQFKCDACPKSFSEEKLLQCHLLWHLTIKEKNLHCAICDQYFHAARHLDDHLKLHHIPNVVAKPEKIIISDVESEPEEADRIKFRCDLCPKVFPSDKLLQSHIYWHQVIKERNHHCKKCNQYFETKESLETHRKTHRNTTNGSTKPPEQESSKPETEKPEEDLSKPKQQKQSTLKEIAKQEKLILKFTKFRCSKCDHEAQTFIDLKHHGESEHGCTSSPVPVICCGKAFNNRIRLYYHCLTHIDPDYFKCECCGKVFKEKKALQGHRQSVHTPASERAFKCDVCGASFAQASKLKQHQDRHTKRLQTLMARQPSNDPTVVPKVEFGKAETNAHSEPNSGSASDSDSSDTPLSKFKEKQAAKRTADSDLALSKYRDMLQVKKQKLADLAAYARDQLACYYCHVENPDSKVKFSSYSVLANHAKEQHGGKKPAMYCGMCDRRFLSEEAFLNDYVKHTEGREQMKECVECNLLFQTEDIYKKHMILSHTTEDEKRFKCNLCPKAFPLEDLLSSHLNWHEAIQQKNHHCLACDLYFISLSKLKEHTDSCPNTAQTPSASVQPPTEPSMYRKFCTPEEIQDQDKLIRKYLTLQCARCDLVSETFAKYRRHSKKEHALSGFGVFCCAKRYTTRFTLYEHCLLHDDPDHFKCKTCDKRCTDSYTLKRHVWTIHTPLAERPFKCDVCGDAFLKEFQLRTHMNFHLSKEQKKFVCPECNRVFSYKYFLTKHMETVHV